jgi:hypothetical protein
MRAIINQVNGNEIKISSQAAASIHEHGIVILHTGKGRLFSSNETGAYIWSCIERQLSLEAIADKISGEFQIARGTALEHTARFAAELERHNLVERRAAC